MIDIAKLMQSWDLPRETELFRAAHEYANRFGDSKYSPTLLMIVFRAGARWAAENVSVPPSDAKQEEATHE